MSDLAERKAAYEAWCASDETDTEAVHEYISALEAEVERWKAFYREVVSDNRAKAEEVGRVTRERDEARARVALLEHDLEWANAASGPLTRSEYDIYQLEHNRLVKAWQKHVAALPTPPEQEAT